MSFFNLWSSERLSFSLSIIAVISAAITTFHQFHSKTDVRVAFSSYRYSVNDSTGMGHIKASGIFMNNGTTPVASKQSSLFITIDRTHNRGKVNGTSSYFIEDSKLYVATDPYEHVLNNIYVAPQSTEVFYVEWEVPHWRVLRLLDAAKQNEQFASWDSSLVEVQMGLMTTLVSPNAESSSKRMYAASQFFDVSDSLNPRPTISALNMNGFYHFESWEPMEENWEPGEDSIDPA